MKLLTLFSTIALLLIAPIAAPSAMAKPTQFTEDFVRIASIGGQYEILSSKLALSKSTNPDIKQYAQKIINDHSNLNDQLLTVLPTSTVKVSVATGSLDADRQKMLDQLTKLDGNSFDKYYINTQITTLDWMVKNFQMYAQNGDDRVLKKFASNNLSTLLQHQHHVKAILMPVATSYTDDFVRMALMSQQYEILSGKLALNKSRNNQVIQFAQQIVDAHTRLNNQLIALLPTSTATIASATTSLDATHQNMMDQLNKLTGSSFDKQYVNTQITMLGWMAKIFQNYATNGTDKVLKDFATTSLPTLLQHHQHAKGILLPASR